VNGNHMRILPRLLLLLPALILLTPTTADAKLAFFRNYPDLEWNVIRTEHFNVFYPESRNPNNKHQVDADFTARKTAFVAEEMYPLVCGQFNYYLDETVNIVMLDQTDELTGYTVPNFDWIVVSAHHSDMLWRLRGHHDWLRNVMYHEFAHVVSLKADQVFAEESFGAVISADWYDGRGSTDLDGDGKQDLGVSVDVEASVFLGTGDPWFWVEGGAEYYTQVAGINTWTSNRDMRMRMDILEGWALNFDDMADYQGSNGGFDGNRHYLSGYSFALYLEERFGEGVYQSFALKRDEKGWSPNWLSVIEDTLNISADELHDDWKVWAMEKYAVVRDEVMKDPAIGTEVGWELSYWNTDSPESLEKLAHVKGFKGAARYKWRADRERATQIYGWGSRFSPDGKWFARSVRWGGQVVNIGADDLLPFSTERSYGDQDLADAQYFKKFAKQFSTTLPDFGFIDFSPDSSKVLVTCGEDVPGPMEAKAATANEDYIDLDGYDWHTMCYIDLAEREEEGRRLYEEYWGDLDPMAEDLRNYERLRRGLDELPTDYEKAVKDKKKVGPKSKLTHWYDFLKPKYTKKGLMHFLGGDEKGNPNPDLRRAAYPTWSPDGRTIAFVKYDDMTQNVWTVDFETGDITELTRWEDGTRIEGLDFSPDGRQIVMGAFRYNHMDIYTVNVDGSDAKALTFDSFEDRDPHWGHDGNIYFTSDRVDSIYNVFKLNPRLEAGRPDADLDGILDADDACPEERENFNLYKDRDGCPDGIPITVSKDKIEIGEKIFFELDSDVIKDESHDLVNAIARVLLENPQIEVIEVQGHTDSQGEDEYNLDLSDRRAASVVRFLTNAGVQPDRLTNKGYGETVPLLEDETEEAFATNRRVEFAIIQQREVSEVRSLESGTSSDITLYGGQSAGAAAIEGSGLTEKKPVHICGQAPDDRYLNNAYLLQVTNVVSGAFTPHLTPKGHLLYDLYQPWGWEPYGLRCEEFHNSVVDDTLLVIDQATVQFAGPQEVYPDYTAVTESVPLHIAFPRNPAIIPILNIGQATLDRPLVDVGFQFAISDALDTNSGFVVGTAGENLLLFTRWTNKQWWPEFYVGGMLRSMKFSYWYDLDDDGSTETTDDRFLSAGKQRYFVGAGFAGVNLPISALLNIDISTFHLYVGIQGVGEGKEFRDLNYRANQTLAVTLRSRAFDPRRVGRSTDMNINPRGGRVFTFTWNPNYTQSLNEATGGVSVDDGQIFRGYHFNRFLISHSEYVKLPWKLPNGVDAGHSLQVEAQVGLVDRNVAYGDEFKAGGGAGNNFRNPFSSNSFFAGYEGFSLSGETQAILHLQYRFPLARQIDTKIGDLYLESAYMQVFGTVGNLWSYRLKDPDNSIEYFGEPTVVDETGRQGGQFANEEHLVREWPGMEAQENGNNVLGDIGVEFRLAAMLFNRSRFFSSFAVAYGFNQVAGRGDVNNDGILSNSADPSINTRSDEKEPGGFRFYIRLGTGW
jgi:outer membrane protein OmpA-like peptidoglycan-associated protein